MSNTATKTATRKPAKAPAKATKAQKSAPTAKAPAAGTTAKAKLLASKLIVNQEHESLSSLRGQRMDWYNRLVVSHGQTVEHFINSNQGVTNNKGNAEPPMGWLTFFRKAGIARIS